MLKPTSLSDLKLYYYRTTRSNRCKRSFIAAQNMADVSESRSKLDFYALSARYNTYRRALLPAVSPAESALYRRPIGCWPGGPLFVKFYSLNPRKIPENVEFPVDKQSLVRYNTPCVPKTAGGALPGNPAEDCRSVLISTVLAS